ncbi:MAG TPA: imidazoleglycerol-phosphate dehydratase HisB [Clostridiaceae bacterium]|jgi:imidazoleglycerol-phosphate dehydratase|nr:imidazoleglycerol-phosphate dehydratase HisB [Clostridiaceae bacterium]
MERKAEVNRATNETNISMSFNLDGAGNSDIETGIGFFDHMLNLFAKHGLFNLAVSAKGDLHVDAHHTVEDAGIVLGQAISKALGDKTSIKRYGTAFVPMDESLAMVSVDLGGRPFLVYDVPLKAEKLGTMDAELVEEFFRAVSYSAMMNIHIKVLYGSNNHHMVEAVFKAFGRALDEASRLDERICGTMSTKGIL